MKNKILYSVFAYLLGWGTFLLLYYFGSSNGAWKILHDLFGIGDYILVAFYFTAITIVTISPYLENLK